MLLDSSRQFVDKFGSSFIDKDLIGFESSESEHSSDNSFNGESLSSKKTRKRIKFRLSKDLIDESSSSGCVHSDTSICLVYRSLWLSWEQIRRDQEIVSLDELDHCKSSSCSIRKVTVRERLFILNDFYSNESVGQAWRENCARCFFDEVTLLSSFNQRKVEENIWNTENRDFDGCVCLFDVDRHVSFRQFFLETVFGAFTVNLEKRRTKIFRCEKKKPFTSSEICSRRFNAAR